MVLLKYLRILFENKFFFSRIISRFNIRYEHGQCTTNVRCRAGKQKLNHHGNIMVLKNPMVIYLYITAGNSEHVADV